LISGPKTSYDLGNNYIKQTNNTKPIADTIMVLLPPVGVFRGPVSGTFIEPTLPGSATEPEVVLGIVVGTVVGTVVLGIVVGIVVGTVVLVVVLMVGAVVEITDPGRV